MRRQVYQPLAPGQAPRPMAYPAQGQVYYSNQYVQQQPQVITVQTHPQTGTVYHQGQVFSSGNSVGTWFNPNYGQNFMVVQSSTPSQSQMLPFVVAPYRSNSAAPQTAVSNASTNDYNSPPAWTQIKPRRRVSVPPSLTTTLLPNQNTLWLTAENETQTNESFSQVQSQIQTQSASQQQKSDTSYQTRPTETPGAESKEECISETVSPSEVETLDEELEAKRLSQQMSVNFHAIMASSPEVTQATVSSSSNISLSVDIVADTALTTSATSPIVSSTVFSKTASVAPVVTSSDTSMLTSSSSLPEDSNISVTTDSISVSDADTTKEVVSEKLPSTESSTTISPFSLLDDVDIQDSDIVDSLRVRATEVAEELMAPSIKEGMFEKKDKELFQPIEKCLLTKEKQTPKAIVKPQVMTHVIDGLVVEEAPEPFLGDAFKSSHKSHSEYQDMPLDEYQDVSPKKLKMNSCRGRKRGKRGRRGRPKLLNLTNDMDVKEVEVVPNETLVLGTQDVEENKVNAIGLLPVPETSDPVKMDEEANVSSINYTKKLPQEWGVEEVFEFIKEFLGCSDYAETFRSQEIDGQALLLLKVDHLVTAMCMKLGPAVKLLSHIRNLKEELSIQSQT